MPERKGFMAEGQRYQEVYRKLRKMFVLIYQVRSPYAFGYSMYHAHMQKYMPEYAPDDDWMELNKQQFLAAVRHQCRQMESEFGNVIKVGRGHYRITEDWSAVAPEKTKVAEAPAEAPAEVPAEVPAEEDSKDEISIIETGHAVIKAYNWLSQKYERTKDKLAKLEQRNDAGQKTHFIDRKEIRILKGKLSKSRDETKKKTTEFEDYLRDEAKTFKHIEGINNSLREETRTLKNRIKNLEDLVDEKNRLLEKQNKNLIQANQQLANLGFTRKGTRIHKQKKGFPMADIARFKKSDGNSSNSPPSSGAPA